LADVDILFLQPAVGRQYGIISLGFLSLSTFLHRHGYGSKIVVLEGKDSEATVEKKILQFKPKIVCVSLHWYIHSYESVKIANAVKKVSPETRVVAGGHTSTYFDRQILEFAPSIDLIIKGDGEKPLLDYVSTLRPDKTENASFIKDDRFVSKPITYHQTSLEGFAAAAPNMGDLIDEWEDYIKKTRIRTAAPISPEEKVEEVETKPSEFYLYIGKGCMYNCVFCGTSKTGSTRIFSRGIALFRPLEEVLQDAKNLKKNGVDSLFVDFGPFRDEAYYQKLFEELAKLDVGLTFLPWNLPSGDLIATIGKSFDPIEIQMSPDSGSERLRNQLWNMGFHRQFYPNDALTKSVEKIYEVGSPKGAQLFIWFICGLPFETEDDFQETVRIARLYKKRFPSLFKNFNDQLNCIPLRLTPGSPIDLMPQRFGIRKLRSSFRDYYEYCRELESGRITHPLGLEREDLSEREIVERALEFKRSLAG